MAWDSEMVEFLRVIILDLEDSPEFSDSRLIRILIVAAFRVNNELEFDQDFEVDIDAATITPDPTATATRNESFINLACLKAACMLDMGGAVQAAKKAGIVKDGRFATTLDLSKIAEARRKLLEIGFCKVYEDAKLQYQAGLVRVAGAAILSPFRTEVQPYNNPLRMYT